MIPEVLAVEEYIARAGKIPARFFIVCYGGGRGTDTLVQLGAEEPIHIILLFCPTLVFKRHPLRLLESYLLFYRNLRLVIVL